MRQADVEFVLYGEMWLTYKKRLRIFPALNIPSCN